MVRGKGASVSCLWFKLDFSGGNWWCPRLNFIIFPDNCRCPWSWNKFAVNMLNRSDWDSDFYSEKTRVESDFTQSKNFAGGGSAVNSAVQSLHSAECAWCRFCVCVRSAVFASGAQVFSIQFPNGAKLSQVVPECCWRTSQVVPSGLYLCHNVATRCVD